jgi:hypothetical protein
MIVLQILNLRYPALPSASRIRMLQRRLKSIKLLTTKPIETIVDKNSPIETTVDKISIETILNKNSPV